MTRLEDDGHSAAVCAPRRARYVRRPLGAQEDDHCGDLLRTREAPEWSARADLGENLVAVSLLLGETALAEPYVRRRRPGCHGVAANAVPRIEGGDEPRGREHGGFRQRGVRHARRTAL